MYDFTYMWNLKTKISITKEKHTHRYRKLTGGWQLGWYRERREIGERD